MREMRENMYCAEISTFTVYDAVSFIKKILKNQSEIIEHINKIVIVSL